MGDIADFSNFVGAVIDAKAFAKISMRLVPDQTPDEIAKKFEAFFNKIKPAGVTIKITDLHGGMPVRLGLRRPDPGGGVEPPQARAPAGGVRPSHRPDMVRRPDCGILRSAPTGALAPPRLPRNGPARAGG